MVLAYATLQRCKGRFVPFVDTIPRRADPVSSLPRRRLRSLTEAVQQGQGVPVVNAPDKNEHLERHHTDAPAEGETEGWVPHDTGLHSQDPAEGPDIDDDVPPSGAS